MPSKSCILQDEDLALLCRIHGSSEIGLPLEWSNDGITDALAVEGQNFSDTVSLDNLIPLSGEKTNFDALPRVSPQGPGHAVLALLRWFYGGFDASLHSMKRERRSRSEL